MTQLSRRWFLGGLIAAPAVVAVGNIMPVRFPLVLLPEPDLHLYVDTRLVAKMLFHARNYGVGDRLVFSSIQDAMNYADQFITARDRSVVVHIWDGVYPGDPIKVSHS